MSVAAFVSDILSIRRLLQDLTQHDYHNDNFLSITTLVVSLLELPPLRIRPWIRV